MDNIIGTILDIDKAASDRLAQAETEGEALVSAAKAEASALADKHIAHADKLLAELEKKEQSAADKMLIALENKETAEISDIEKTYEKNKENWINEIVTAIVEC